MPSINKKRRKKRPPKLLKQKSQKPQKQLDPSPKKLSKLKKKKPITTPRSDGASEISNNATIKSQETKSICRCSTMMSP